MIDIEGEGLNALDEYTASCTVVITSTAKGFEHGTGVAVQYGNENYILTAAHVLKGEPDNEKIMIIGKPDAPLKLLPKKQQFTETVFKGNQGRVATSVATHISITDRLVNNDGADIAALKVQNSHKVLPHTVFHNLSDQGETHISVGEAVSIYGFPGELAQKVEHRITGRQGMAGFPHVTLQAVREISDAPEPLDPSIDLIIDFTYDEETCDPRGMSGCGAWSIPSLKEGKIWSPHESQLLGIQSGFYPKSKLLKFVRIEHVLNLLSGG